MFFICVRIPLVHEAFLAEAREWLKRAQGEQPIPFMASVSGFEELSLQALMMPMTMAMVIVSESGCGARPPSR